MESEERGNALKLATCDGFYGVGTGFVALLTVLPLLFSLLGAGTVELGLLFSIGTVGWFTGQPVGLLVLGRRPRRRRFFTFWLLSIWVPSHLAMAALVYGLGPVHPRLCRYGILALFAFLMLADGMIVPLWTVWQASLFRRGSRGRALGLIAGASALGAGVGSLAAGKVQDYLLFPLNYAVLFLAASLLFSAALNFLWRVREPEGVVGGEAPLRAADLVRLAGLSLRQTNFRRYMASKVLLAVGGGAAAFYAVHFRSPGGGALGGATVIKLGALTALSQALSSYMLGGVGDRAGHRRAAAIGFLAQTAAIATAYVGRGWFACAACFAVLGVSWSAGWVSHNNLLFETCPHGSRAAHLTLSNTLLGPFAALAPPVTGWLIAQAGMRTSIGLTLIPTVLGFFWLLLAVKEPRDVELSAAAALAGEGA